MQEYFMLFDEINQTVDIAVNTR